MNSKYILIAIFLLFNLLATSQTKLSLSKEIEKTKKEIEFTNKLLQENEQNKLQSYNGLLLLNKKISLRRSYISTLNKEVNILSKNIETTEEKIFNLQADVRNLKAEYAKMIFYAYVNRNSYERLMFILSSDDFNQAYRRIKYFQQYSDYRKNQVEKIIAMQDTLKIEMAKYQSAIEEKKVLLAETHSEEELLKKEKNQQTEFISSLELKAKELKVELDEKIRLADKLQKEIEKIVAEEQRKKTEAEKLKKTPKDKIISKKFGENKGRLPWPTTEGIITSRFGEHAHPVLKNIKVMNNGIDITTSPNATVRAVFDGVVSKIIVIPGANAAILIRHGDYLTVYNNLVNVKVKTGQAITAKQEIGTVFTEPDTKKTVLQLQIWKETEKLNPEEWLSKSK